MDWAAGATGRLAGVTEVSVILGCSRARADQLSRQQGFPKPYDVLGSPGKPQRIWLVRDIHAWHRENPKIGRNDPA